MGTTQAVVARLESGKTMPSTRTLERFAKATQHHNSLAVSGNAAAYSLTLDSSTLSVSGALTVGTSLSVNDDSTLALNGGTLSAQSISSNSYASFSGYGAVSGALSGGVYMTAVGGTLQVQGSLAGDLGNFMIDAGATLELGSGGAAPVIFDGNPATLKLDAPAAFTGAIEDVVVGDVIDLAGITASSASYSGSTLTINETNGQQIVYDNVTGSLAGFAVTTASDNNGGTLVYWGAAPLPSASTLSDASVVNGYVNAANDTTTQALTGTAGAGDTINVYLNGSTTPAFTTTANAVTGAWSVTLGALANGSYSYAATATDAAGNTSSLSSRLSFTVDTTAPSAPTLSDASVVNGYVNAANDTATQALTGMAGAGDTINVYLNGSTTPAFTTTANAVTGAWSVTLGVLANGPYSYAATATDAAGNTSVASGAYSFIVDAVGPA